MDNNSNITTNLGVFKMGFKEVASLDADTTVSLGGFNKKTKKDNPTSAEGYYLGKRTVTTKTGDASLHFLQTPKGNLGVWGKTDMNKKLSQVIPGSMIRITFTKMVPTPRGDMYSYKVEADTHNSIDVSSLTESSSQDENSFDTADGADDSGNFEESIDETLASEEEAALLAAAEAKVAAQKAKIDGILKRGGKKA